jgi:coenzyme F420-0:L-glutamate ligase/coenzyme F420-1:gamma-L-glutamate ligase
MEVIAVRGLPEIEAGADIGALLAAHVRPNDIVVIAQKIVSKAEGRVVRAGDRSEARAVARREARRVVRETAEHLIVETMHGFVCANAGVDSSNVPDGFVTLLPRDPDASADRVRATIERTARPVAVIISDTFGRAWRTGQTNVAIGSSGIGAFRDYRGVVDAHGHELAVTQIAHLDELAAAAELVMRKADGVPVAIVRGYEWEPGAGTAVELIRPVAQDLFR